MEYITAVLATEDATKLSLPLYQRYYLLDERSSEAVLRLNRGDSQSFSCCLSLVIERYSVLSL